MRGHERLDNIFQYVSRWRFVGILAWGILPSLFILHLESLTWVTIFLLIFFATNKVALQPRLLVFLGSLIFAYFMSGYFVISRKPLSWIMLLADLVILMVYFFFLERSLRVGGKVSRKQHGFGLAVTALLYFWVFSFRDLFILDNPPLASHYWMYFGTGVVYAVLFHAISELNGKNTFTFPSVRQIRLVRIRQAVPLLMQYSIKSLLPLLCFGFVQVVLYYIGSPVSMINMNVWTDLAFKQLICTFILQYMRHVYCVVSTERLDLLMLLKDHHANDQLSDANNASIIASNLRSGSGTATLTLRDYHLWDSFNTLTQTNSASCRYFFSNIETWWKVRDPCFQSIEAFTQTLSQRNQQQQPTPSNKEWPFLHAYLNQYTNTDSCKDIQIVLWAIGCMPSSMSRAGLKDKHGTLQLHDELAILMDLLTSAYKVTEQHIDTTTNEARNYTQVHVVQAELVTAIYMLRNTFSSVMENYSFAHADVLQRFADYQVL